MAERSRVFELARELGVSIALIIRVAEHLRLPVRRGIAQLTPRQKLLIREEIEHGGWRAQMRRPDDEAQSRTPANSVRYSTCECCGLPFTYQLQEPEKPRWCRDCAGHYEIKGESQDRAIARHADHEHRVRIWYQQASRKATEYEGRMKAAFASRQKWKAALVEVALYHESAEDDKCICGADKYPCATIRMLEYVNKGIARQVERLAALSREELDRELYPDQPWNVDPVADDTPWPPTAASDNPAA